MATQLKLLVGTRKGAFIYTSDEKRQRWEISEPILPGWTFHHMSGDARSNPPRLYAAANHWAWGRSVAKSTDGGKTWDYRSEGLAFPPDMKSPSTRVPGEWQNRPPGTIGNIWSVTPGHESQPGVVFAGTQPAAARTGAIPGVRSRRSTATPTASTGRAPAAATRASTRSRSTRAIQSASTSASAQEAHTNRRTAGKAGSSSRTTQSLLIQRRGS